MDQELDMERRQAQSDQISGSQGQGLGKSTDCILSVAGKYVCLWCLPPGEGRGAPAEKWPYLSWAGLLFSGTHSCGLGFFFFFFWSKNFLAFDLSRWVGLCRVFSLVCGVSALPLQRQDVISVMSVQGFTVSYWLLFTDSMANRGL